MFPDGGKAGVCVCVCVLESASLVCHLCFLSPRGPHGGAQRWPRWMADLGQLSRNWSVYTHTHICARRGTHILFMSLRSDLRTPCGCTLKLFDTDPHMHAEKNSLLPSVLICTSKVAQNKHTNAHTHKRQHSYFLFTSHTHPCLPLTLFPIMSFSLLLLWESWLIPSCAFPRQCKSCLGILISPSAPATLLGLPTSSQCHATLREVTIHP